MVNKYNTFLLRETKRKLKHKNNRKLCHNQTKLPSFMQDKWKKEIGKDSNFGVNLLWQQRNKGLKKLSRKLNSRKRRQLIDLAKKQGRASKRRLSTSVIHSKSSIGAWWLTNQIKEGEGTKHLISLQLRRLSSSRRFTDKSSTKSSPQEGCKLECLKNFKLSLASKRNGINKISTSLWASISKFINPLSSPQYTLRIF